MKWELNHLGIKSRGIRRTAMGRGGEEVLLEQAKVRKKKRKKKKVGGAPSGHDDNDDDRSPIYTKLYIVKRDPVRLEF